MHKYVIFLMILAFLAIGCSSNSSPVMPEQEIINMNTLPVIDTGTYGDSFNAIGLMGNYELILNTDDMSADLISKRGSAVGEGYIVSGLSFFTITPCSDCLKISNISLDSNNNIVLGMSISHPFFKGDPLKPPSGMNRLDLDVFDVTMLVAPQNLAPDSFPLLGMSAYSGICVNPDGYSAELANVIGDSSALPYFLVIDDSKIGLSTFNRLEMGESASFEAKFEFGKTDELRFDLYLTMGYGASARRAQRLSPKYYNPEFNRNAAWKIDVIPPGPAEMGSTWNDSDSLSEFDVEVRVYDWQQNATIYNNPADFENAPTDNIYAASNVAEVSVEIPGMTGTIPRQHSPTSGSGSPSDPLVYVLPIANENLLVAGQYFGLVKVADERVPASNWMTDQRDFLIDTPDGIMLNNYHLNEYATYQLFSADVVIGCGPITGRILSPDPCPDNAANGQTLSFEVTASSENGGDPVILYEVDYDYDGVSFNSFTSNTNGIFDNVGPFLVPSPCENNIPHDFTVAFRATDSCVPPNQTIFATCTVTVNSCLTPVGDVVLTVNYIVADIIPPAVIPHGWQFDYNGVFTLSWDPVPGAAEYAIYYDNDPADGLKTEPLLLVGTTASNTYTVPPNHLPANHHIPGNTYYVCSRAEFGGTNAPESEPAFVTISGYETGSYFDPTCEGWESHCQANNTDFRYSPYVDGWGLIHIHGSNNVFFSNQFFGPNNENRWHGWAKETPDVPDSTVRYLSFSARTYGIWSPHGMFIGTISAPTIPRHNWQSPTDMSWASVDSINGFDGYNFDSASVRNTFSDVPEGNNSWYTALASQYDTEWYNFMCGGDVNTGGATSNAADPFVAIEIVKLQQIGPPQTVIDEVAIAIY